MNKVIDLEMNVAGIAEEYPEVKNIMAELGFTDVVKPLALNTMGRMVTLVRGAGMKNIPLENVIRALQDNGFTCVNVPEEYAYLKEESKVPEMNLTDNEKLLQSYVERLTSGEDLESVQADFKANFTDVSALEIARAEQALLNSGAQLNDVQKLCDVHSVLFHGSTQAERIAEAENEVARNLEDEKIHSLVAGFDDTNAKKTSDAMQETGHPLHVLTLENHAIEQVIAELENTEGMDEKQSLVKKLQAVASHYGKKDELMFPLLADEYNYPGPGDVMWGVEDEIRDELKQVLAQMREGDESYNDHLSHALTRMKEMIYKEENILFPLCIDLFTEEQWIAIAKDMPKFGACLIDDIPVWGKAVNFVESKNASAMNDKIVLAGGSMTLEQLRSILNCIPMEISVIDENDINIFFNEGEKLFTRPAMAIGRPLYSCHPKRVEPMVRMLVHDMKTGKRDEMHMIAEKNGKKVLVNYYALRNEDGKYLGIMECTQVLDGILDAVNSGKKGPITI